MMEKYNKLENYLDELFPNPKCELNYFNDYSLLIAVMLSAQTKDVRVNEVTKILFSKYKNLEELSKASIIDMKKLIKPLGNYNRKAQNVIDISNILINKYNGKVPTKRKDLEDLPGVGHKTCNVFYAEYLKIPSFAVDTHVLRVSKRLNLVKENSDVLTVENTLKRNIKRENWSKRHLQMVLFGRYHCFAKNPLCENCNLKDICKYKTKR